jgi:arylsulfatase A-like enzyme/lipopolysaccharide biosynthesis regulator YciM
MNKYFCAVIGLIFIFAIGCKSTKTETPKLQPYNLLLISIDTCRADYLQLYNQNGAPTPNLVRLATNGFLFTNAISQVPFTLPSHSTMLTGTYPMKHLVQENVGSKLGDDAVTLAEVLKSNGYQTAGFIGAVVLESGTGIEQGFDTFDDVFVRENKIMEDRSGIQKDAGSVKRSFLRWLDQKNNSPFFSFVHFYDAHAPYDPPPAFTPSIREPKALYRGELQYVDSVIGEIANELSQRNLLNQTIIVITGDHGEMLGEHGERGHGFFIYQESLHVPLLVLVPGHKSGRTDAVVELVDLMPTILELLGIKVPESVQGKSVAGLLNGSKVTDPIAYSESLTAMQHFGAEPLRSVQDQHYKYIDTVKPELYDLNKDQREMNNIVEQKKEIASRMKASLHQIVSKYNAAADKRQVRTLTPEQQEQLASLGYIGSTETTEKSRRNLDAKDLIESWNELGELSNLVKQPNCKECLNIIARMRSRGELPTQAQIFEARAYSGLHQYDKAISILEKIVSANPHHAPARIALAAAYNHAGNISSALSIYKKMMEQDNSLLGLENYAELMIVSNKKDELRNDLDKLVSSGKLNDKYNAVLGEIYLLLQQPEQAQQFLSKAIEVSPEDPSSYIHISELMDAQGRTFEAIRYLEQNRERLQSADYILQLGRLYAKSGNAQKEYELFQQMVSTYPKDARGYFFLGKIYLENKADMNEVIRLAETGLSLNPDPEFQPFGYFLLADAYTALGQEQKAQSYLQTAEKLRQSKSNLQ